MQQVLLIVATLIFVSSNVLCQMALTAEQVTKLKNIARDNKTGNGERLRALDELYQTESLLINPDTLKFYSEITLKLAQLEGDKDMVANGLIAYGSAFLTVEELNKSDSCFKLAQNLITPQSRPIIRASLLINRAMLLSAKGLNDAAIDLYKEAITLGEANNLTRTLVAAENNLGNLIAQQGDIATAVKYFVRGLELSEQLGDSAGMGNMLSNIGSCNKMLGNLEESRAYFHRAVSIFKKINHPNLPRPLFNIGSTYFGEDSDSLNKYIDLTYDAAGRIGDLSMQSMAYLLKADNLEAQNNLVEAEKYLYEAMDLASKANNPLYVNNIIINLARNKGRQGSHAEAIRLVEEILDVKKSSANLFQQIIASEALIREYKAIGNHQKAMEMLELNVELKEKLHNEENQRQTIKQEYAYNYQKQAMADSLSFAAEKEIQVKEIQRQKVIRNGFMGGFVLVAFFAGVFLYQRKRISREKQRSEDLLLNILPEEVAEELKAKGAADAVQIDQVTVLFTDFKGFTAMSEILSPKDLVKDLHECFSAFDHICEKYGIEKIKTIGDAYMAAGGLPSPNKTHPHDAVMAALEMAGVVQLGKEKKIAGGQPFFEVRIGIHTGPVVAGIVGVKKFQYDIWGDTVNTASRMESSGSVGKVNISQNTFELLKDDPKFSFESRGKVEAKGKGAIEMYFVSKKENA